MMSRESYFAQYASPNIVIVPTVSFSPPESDVKAEPITNPPICEQTSPNNYYGDPTAPKESFHYKDNITSVDTNFSTEAISESTRATNYILISPFETQSTFSTEVPSYLKSPRIKELSSAQYKSRNSLVDFTGFNRIKWDRGNHSDKYRDYRRIDTNIESDTMKSNRENEHRKSSDKNTRKSDDMVDKESSKSVKPISSLSKKMAEQITNIEIKQFASDVEEKMKKCFNQLWKRNVEKLRAKYAKEKHEKIKRMKEHSKNLKPESSRSKSHLQGVTKNTTLTSIRNKTIDKVKKNHDFEKSKRSKSKGTNEERKVLLSPISMKRYKDFQQFVRDNDDDDETKNNAEHERKRKTEQIHNKKRRIISCETITKPKPDIKTKVNSKQAMKETTNKERHSEFNNTSKNNIERVKPIKSVVQVRNNSQGRFFNGEQDLRIRLSRKRAKTDQENETIRLKQDSKADSKISNMNKPKKNKKLKVTIINIECPRSDDSEDSDQHDNEDISFLDDIDIDEIVDSLDDKQTQVEHNFNKQIYVANAKFLLKDKVNENQKNACNEETKVEKSMNNGIKTKKEKTRAYEQLKDLTLKSGSGAREKQKNKQVTKTSSRITKNKQSSNNKDLTEKPFAKDLQENIKKELKSNKGESKVDHILELSTKKRVTPELKNRSNSTVCTNGIKKTKHSCKRKDSNKGNSTMVKETERKVDEKSKLNSLNKAAERAKLDQHKFGDPIEASLVTMFSPSKQTDINDVTTHPTSCSGKDKKADNQVQNSSDPVEASLETMFSVKKKEVSRNLKHSEAFNESGKQKNNILQKSNDAVATSIEIIPGDNKQVAVINKVKQSSLNDNNKEKDLPKKSEETIKKPHEMSFKNCERTVARTETKSLYKRDNLINNKSEKGHTGNHQKTIKEHASMDIGLSSKCKKDTKDEEHLPLSINRKCDETTIQRDKMRPPIIKDKQVQNKPETNVSNEPENLQKTIDEDIIFVEKTISITRETNFADKPSEKSDKSSDPGANNSDPSINKTVASSTNGEQETNIRNEPLNVCDTKTKENTPLIVQGVTLKPLEEFKNNVQTNSDNTSREELLKNDDTNKENPSGTNSVATTEKSSIEDNNNKSLQTDKDDKKPATSSSKLNSTAINVLNKSSELVEHTENVSNSNKNQEIENAKKNIVLEGSQKKDETKPDNDKTEVKMLFTASVETELFHILNARAEVTSRIQNGRFSVIHNCRDSNGKTYALKVMRPQFRQLGPDIGKLLFGMKDNDSKDIRPILHLISCFEVQQQYCLLTEFYPKNLGKALMENNRGFHINLVQVLSRQLVDALNMLSDHHILHTDIKPEHILLNSTNDKLKLCGFERAGYQSDIKMNPGSGTHTYRAPEIILGYPEYHKIDVWSTALVMFKMATNADLFSGIYNNEILYQHLCTTGSFDWTMIEKSKYRHRYFSGSRFKLQTGIYDWILVHVFQDSDRLRQQLFTTYTRDWSQNRTSWQMTNDLDKLKTLHSLLVQMLDFDPRIRLPIQFVGVSEFLNSWSHTEP